MTIESIKFQKTIKYLAALSLLITSGCLPLTDFIPDHSDVAICNSTRHEVNLTYPGSGDIMIPRDSQLVKSGIETSLRFYIAIKGVGKFRISTIPRGSSNVEPDGRKPMGEVLVIISDTGIYDAHEISKNIDLSADYLAKTASKFDSAGTQSIVDYFASKGIRLEKLTPIESLAK